MIKQLTEKLNNEMVQRAVLQTGAAVVTILVAQAVSTVVSKQLMNGIDQLMEKLHPVIETPAE